MSAFTIFEGDSPSSCTTAAVVCSEECAHAWLDEHAPWHGGYAPLPESRPILCEQCIAVVG